MGNKTRVIALANRKGGVGKTTLALALATKLAEEHRTLLIDLDSQANATEALAVQLQPGVLTWLVADQPPEVVRLASGVELLPGNAGTEKANLILSSEADIGGIDRRLAEVAESYRYVILDCPPSLSMLTRAAIYAADWVLVPTTPEYLSVAGVRQLTVLMAQIREKYRRSVQLLGVQPNKYDRRTNEHKHNLRDLVRRYGAWGQNGGRVWPPLRQSIAVAEASAEGRPVWEKLDGKLLLEWEGMVGRVKSHG